jgi:hypothetical protein
MILSDSQTQCLEQLAKERDTPLATTAGRSVSVSMSLRLTGYWAARFMSS